MNWDTAPQEMEALRQQVVALTKELSECRNQYIGLEGMYGLLQQERDGLLALDSITKEALSREQEALAASQAREAQLRGELTHIREYWNGSRNDRAMHDALIHIDTVVDAALALTADTSALENSGA